MVFGKFSLNSTSVTNSRYFKRSNIIWRRRKTDDGFTFTTRESVDFSTVQVLKSTDTTENYQPAKLLTAILGACAHLDNPHNDAWYLMQTIEIKLLNHLSENLILDTVDINDVAAETLKAFNQTAYVKYVSFKGELPEELDIN